MAAIVQLEKITKVFTDREQKLVAVRNVDLTINKGEFFIILGPSGCGKSTLLRIMSGLEKSYRGTVRFASGIARNDMSFVFQQFALLPWLTVAENIALGLRARHVDRRAREDRVTRELKRFKLEKFADSHIRELSGGMRQRVGIARALAIDPKVIFLDEPFSELDSFTAATLRQELLGIWQQTRATVIMVTHNIEEAIELADRIAVMTPRPGRIEKVITNDLPRPRHKRSHTVFALEDKLYRAIKV